MPLGAFIATQLNSTELNSTAWTTIDSVCRSWRHKQKHNWLGCTLFNWVSWVQLNSVELCRYKHPFTRSFVTRLIYARTRLRHRQRRPSVRHKPAPCHENGSWTLIFWYKYSYHECQRNLTYKLQRLQTRLKCIKRAENGDSPKKLLYLRYNRRYTYSLATSED